MLLAPDGPPRFERRRYNWLDPTLEVTRLVLRFKVRRNSSTLVLVTESKYTK
jgi:hypothetical protein